jgi:hypothetical protein
MTAGGGSLAGIEQDCNATGTLSNGSSGSGTISGSFDSNGRGTAALTVGGSASHFTVYMVSSSKLLMVNSDAAFAVSGEADLQTVPVGGFMQTSLLGTGTMYLNGLSGSAGGKSQLGLGVADGVSSLALTTYIDAAGTWETPLPTLATCTYAVASNGRVALSGASCVSAPPIIYLTGLNAGFVLGTDAGVSVGPLSAQATGPFTNASVSGAFFLGTSEVVSQAMTTEVGIVTLNGTGGVSLVSDTTSTSSQSADVSSSDTIAANANGTFTTGSSGTTVVGLIFTGSEFAIVNSASSVYPSLSLCQH